MKGEWKGRDKERDREEEGRMKGKRGRKNERKKIKEDEKAVIRQRVTSRCVCSQCNVVRNQMNEWMCV